MKKLLPVLFLIVKLTLPNATFAQQNEYGAFGAPVLKYTSFVGQSALMAGGKFGWIINKSIVLGGGIYSLVSQVKANSIDPISGQEFMIAFNYGGLEFEYILLSDLPVHASVDMLFAGGGLSINVADRSVPHASYYGQNLLVWEPALNIETRIVDWLHIDAGISYRMISSFDSYGGITKNDLTGLNGVLTFKFGKY